MEGRGEHTPGMHRAEPLPPIVKACAARQDGILTRAQLADFGLGDSQIARLHRQQVLHKVDRAVYQLGGMTTGFPQYAWAAVLLGGRGARLLGRSAGAYEKLCEPELPITLGVPLGHGLRSRSWIRVVRERPEVRAGRWIGAPARTIIEDTVLDMCNTARDEAEVIAFVTSACQRRTTPERLELALARRQRLAHRILIEAMVAETVDGVRSPLESRWIRNVERPHGLPAPKRQYRLPSGAYADGAYEEFRVLLELDGKRWHDGSRRFRDWRRDNSSSEDGWLTLRYGWLESGRADACDTAGNVGRVLRNRGWLGGLTLCPRCPSS